MRNSKISRLFVCGVIIFLVLKLPLLLAQSERYRQRSLAYLDTLLEKQADIADRIQLILMQSSPRLEQVAAVEQKNRQLYAQLALCQTQMQGSSVSATLAANQKSEVTIQSKLSFAGGAWIVLSGSNEGVNQGDMVSSYGVFLGIVSVVHQTYSGIETLSSLTTPLLVQHQHSLLTGVLQNEGSELLVQFSKRVDPLTKGYVFLTVPDGAHAKNPYPIVILESEKSGVMDSTSIVKVKPIANPQVGMNVTIVLHQD